MTDKKADQAAAPVVTEDTPVVDAAVTEDEWVAVVHESDKKGPPGVMPRAYFEGWGKDKGYTEVKH